MTYHKNFNPDDKVLVNFESQFLGDDIVNEPATIVGRGPSPYAWEVAFDNPEFSDNRNFHESYLALAPEPEPERVTLQPLMDLEIRATEDYQTYGLAVNGRRVFQGNQRDLGMYLLGVLHPVVPTHIFTP